MSFRHCLAILAATLILAGATRPAHSQWAPGGAVVSGDGGGYQPRICPDGSGGAIVAWYGGVFGVDIDSNIYYQHLLSSGTIAPDFSAIGTNAAGRSKPRTGWRQRTSASPPMMLPV